MLLVLLGAGTSVGAATATARSQVGVAALGVDSLGRATALLRGSRDSKPVVARFGAEGTLDPSFSGDGILRPPLRGDSANLALQADGRLVIGGFRAPDSVVRRYLVTGAPDLSFGRDGSVRIRRQSPRRVFVTGDGHVIAVTTHACHDCGYVNVHVYVKRFSPGGELLRGTHAAGGSWRFGAAGLESGGRLVVAGEVFDASFQTFYRFRADARLDLSLGGRYGAFDDELSSVRALAVEPGGAFVVALSYVGLSRRQADGSPDETFGQRGEVVCADPGANLESPGFSRVAIAPAGEVVAVGAPGDCGLVRYLADGRPDPSFGTAGRVDVEALGMPQPQALAVLPDGAVLVAGWDRASAALRIARFDANGVLDPSYGSGGIASWLLSASG